MTLYVQKKRAVSRQRRGIYKFTQKILSTKYPCLKLKYFLDPSSSIYSQRKKSKRCPVLPEMVRAILRSMYMSPRFSTSMNIVSTVSRHKQADSCEQERGAQTPNSNSPGNSAPAALAGVSTHVPVTDYLHQIVGVLPRGEELVGPLPQHPRHRPLPRGGTR